jgi:hypothetical protein
MAENPFASLVPKAQPGGNPFASLVPQKSAGGNPFASLVPKAQPGVAARVMGAVGSGLGETWNRTKEGFTEARNDMGDAYQEGRDIARAGVEQFKQPGVLPKITGAADIVRGGIGMDIAPIMALINAANKADPMMTGGEGLHVAGEALKAPEKPVAAPAIKSGEQVFTGPNHAAMREATGLKDPETGFVKQDGQFIGRKEAAAEVIQAGEAAPATTGKGLHSEDLPPEQKPSLVAPVGKDNAYTLAPRAAGEQQLPMGGAKLFDITKAGKPVGVAVIELKGDTAYVHDVYANDYADDRARGKLGTKAMAQVARSLKEQFPEVKKIAGERVSGARFPDKTKTPSSGPQVSVSLPKQAGETVLGKPAPKGLSAQANIIPDAPAKDAKLLLRQRIGLGKQDTKQSVAAIQPYEKALNTLDKQGERDFWRYVENRSKENAPPRPSDPHIADAADAWRAAAQQRERKMAAFDDAEKMTFREDYGPHMYAETKPNGQGGTGLGAFFTKKGELPTFEAAEAAGFTPRYRPAEMMGRYLALADKHIALKEAREIAKEAKEIKRAPFGKQPEGWVELKGTRNAFGNALYAPPEWAQAYNRTVDYVPHGGLWGSVRSVANASQALSFFLNARHFVTVGVEAMGAEVARAASHTAAGEFKTAAGAGLKSIYAVGHYGLKGNKGLKIYNGLLTSGSKEENEIVSLLTQANAHSGGKLNYMSATKHGGLYKSYKAGSIPAEFKQYRANIAAKKTLLGKGAETAKTALTLIGRVMDDIQEPLFGYAIPRVKYGVSMEAMGDWLRLNPMATHAEKLAMAAKISDHVDNVFGELMMDNRFLDAKVREGLETALISVGWNYGFYSELGHGGASAVKSLGRSMNPKSPHYDPRTVGLMGMVAGSVIYNAVYQAVKTRAAPSEPMDFVAAKTGGKNPDGTPARIAPITNMKEFVDLKYVLDAALRGELGKGAVEYARSKVKSIFTMAIDLVSGTDWKSQPILKPPSLIAGTGGEKAFNVAKEWTSNLLDFAWGGGKPFILNDRRGPNSGISDVERWLGLQPAGKRLANPKGSEESATRRGERNWHAKERGDAKQKALYKGARGQ